MNGHNDNVCDGISDFTLSRYIEKKMVSGSVRLHLLMAEEASLPDDQNGDKHKDDPDYLPDLPCLSNGSHNGTLYVAASPSGEVLIKENLLMPPSTMSIPSGPDGALRPEAWKRLLPPDDKDYRFIISGVEHGFKITNKDTRQAHSIPTTSQPEYTELPLKHR